MDILFISGSPVKNRNNDQAVKRMMDIAKAEGFKFLDSIFLSKKGVGPCIDCDKCKAKPQCFDKTANEMNKKIADARAIIVCSPVYFGSMSAQLKALFDRTRPLRRHGMKLSGKLGAAVAIGAARNGGQELTIQGIHAWMHIHGMIVVGDNSHFGGALQVPLVNDSEGLLTLEGTVKKVCDTLSKL